MGFEFQEQKAVETYAEGVTAEELAAEQNPEAGTATSTSE